MTLGFLYRSPKIDRLGVSASHGNCWRTVNKRNFMHFVTCKPVYDVEEPNRGDSQNGGKGRWRPRRGGKKSPTTGHGLQIGHYVLGETLGIGKLFGKVKGELKIFMFRNIWTKMF